MTVLSFNSVLDIPDIGATLNCTESHGSHSKGLAIAADRNLDSNADSRYQLSIAVA